MGKKYSKAKEFQKMKKKQKEEKRRKKKADIVRPLTE